MVSLAIRLAPLRDIPTSVGLNLYRQPPVRRVTSTDYALHNDMPWGVTELRCHTFGYMTGGLGPNPVTFVYRSPYM